MTGGENLKGGLVPEGVRIRIKTTIDTDAVLTARASADGWSAQRLAEAKIIAKAWQVYGAWVGDNSGSGSVVKLDAVHRKYPLSSPPTGVNNWAVEIDDLASFPFEDSWEAIAANYDPPLT